jgi:hypothetical protein
VEVKLPSFFILELYQSEWLAPYLAALPLGKEPPIQTGQEVGWTSEMDKKKMFCLL